VAAVILGRPWPVAWLGPAPHHRRGLSCAGGHGVAAVMPPRGWVDHGVRRRLLAAGDPFRLFLERDGCVRVDLGRCLDSGSATSGLASFPSGRCDDREGSPIFDLLRSSALGEGDGGKIGLTPTIALVSSNVGKCLLGVRKHRLVLTIADDVCGGRSCLVGCLLPYLLPH
jgi:hypothetical protein